ncbi:MAG: aquaporin family protein [Bacteroidetes bacterium]|nr:aquaporin family protein [Bacteroidota bacterium]
MNIFMSELIGTALLLLFGGGVVANVLLEKSKGMQGGWLVINFGWAMAVFIGVYSSVHLGGQGHLNPAVSIGMLALGKIASADLIYYITAQFAGAMLGATLVWLLYHPHFAVTQNADFKMGVFCTAPAIHNPLYNFIAEGIGTFAFVFGVLCISPAAAKMGSLDALPVSLLVLGIGLCLGGPTGYGINPARDLGPRIMHFLLPIPGKRDSDWSYSWIPVFGPIAGALLAAFLYGQLMP